MKNITVSKSLNCKISKSINPTLKNLNNINRFRFIVLLLITSTFCTFPVNGQWVKVGYNHQGISESIAGNVSLAFSNEGNPFVAFTDDYLNAGNLAVKKFNYNYLDLRWRLQAMFPVPDTLSVQLRNSIYPYEVVDSAKVFAELSSTNFRKTIRFKNIITGNSYYIVAKHRTSIETWSAYPVEFLSDANSAEAK